MDAAVLLYQFWNESVTYRNDVQPSPWGKGVVPMADRD